jgi:SAM-dependent methyltransferase
MNNLENNKYSSMQKHFYRKGTTNHEGHNKNPLYWDLLLKDLKNKDYWVNKKALDFGCGKGRNVTNMLSLCDWERVDGVDISENNIKHCFSEYPNSMWYCNNGVDLSEIPSEEYDFIMSTIVIQHICVHEIRISLLKEIYRVMKENGIFSFQMGFDEKAPKKQTTVGYFENHFEAKSTNSDCDTRVENAKDLIDDLKLIGFKNITYKIEDSYSDSLHVEWIYLRMEK